MDVLAAFEAIAKSGVAALVLSLFAVRYLAGQLEKLREQHAKDEKACADRIERIQNALQALYGIASRAAGGKRANPLPPLEEFTTLPGEPPERITP